MWNRDAWIDVAAAVTFGARPEGAALRLRQAAYAVIPDSRGRVAAISANVRGRDEFWLPGGGRETGETAVQTIEREVREELGQAVRVLHRIGDAVQFFFAGDRGCWYEMHACFYLAELAGPVDARAGFTLHRVDADARTHEFFHACHVWACRRSRECL